MVFLRVVEAKEQVVAGTLHHLIIEAIDVGKKKIYEAKVCVKPWLGFKELQEFTHKGDVTSFTTSDHGVKREGHEPGWREVPVHDPVVKDAASYAVTSIQERSNSLLPHELVDVIHAKAEPLAQLFARNLVRFMGLFINRPAETVTTILHLSRRIPRDGRLERLVQGDIILDSENCLLRFPIELIRCFF